MKEVTVCCVFVKGHVKEFRPEHVQKLARMVRLNMDRPHRFTCLTDYVGHFYAPDIEVIKIPAPALLPKPMPMGYVGGRRVFAWWSKLECFNPAHGFTGRMLYLDLDTLVVDALAPILDYPADFALVPDAGTFKGKFGLKVVKRFNSSVMVWDAGCEKARRVWGNYKHDTPMRLWGDQDHIGEQIPDATKMPAEWFPRISALEMRRPVDPVKVVLSKWPKNTLAAERYPWVREVWV